MNKSQFINAVRKAMILAGDSNARCSDEIVYECAAECIEWMTEEFAEKGYDAAFAEFQRSHGAFHRYQLEQYADYCSVYS